MNQNRCAVRGDVLEVLTFTYQAETGVLWPIRIVMLDGDPWFIARDVCAATGALMMHAIYRRGPDQKDLLLVDEAALCDESGTMPVSPGDGGVWLLSEARFYQVTSSFRGTRGYEVKRWAMYEVLPTLRHLHPPSNVRVDLPMVQETVSVATLLKYYGSDSEDPDRPIRKDRKPARKKKQPPHYLYRLFDERDRLLYVGESWSAPSRAKQHRSGQQWWDQVRRMTVEVYSSRETALAAEAEAIRTEKPRYNRAGVVKRPAKKLA